MSVASFIAIYFSLFLHPYHVSTTEILHNQKTNSIEVSVKIFSGDFEKVLKKNCNCSIDIVGPKDRNKVEKLVSSYIAEHLSLYLDGQAKVMSFVGYEREDESTWAFFEIKDVGTFSKLEVKNSILFEDVAEQVNILHLRALDRNVTTKLVNPNTDFIFQ